MHHKSWVRRRRSEFHCTSLVRDCHPLHCKHARLWHCSLLPDVLTSGSTCYILAIIILKQSATSNFVAPKCAWAVYLSASEHTCCVVG